MVSQLIHILIEELNCIDSSITITLKKLQKLHSVMISKLDDASIQFELFLAIYEELMNERNEINMS